MRSKNYRHYIVDTEAERNTNWENYCTVYCIDTGKAYLLVDGVWNLIGIGISDANLLTTDITTNNVSITKHGFAPKAPNDATKYLDGTGAYSIPDELYVVLASQQTTTSTTFADLTGLSFSVAINSTYIFDAYIVWQSNDINYGIGFSINGPAGKTYAVATAYIPTAAAGVFIMSIPDYNLPNITSAAPQAANTDYISTMRGIIKIGGTSGTLQIVWRSENASGTMTAQIGSTLKYRKVA